MGSESKSILQSVDNALQILDLFENNSELGVTEISRLMGCGKSTSFRLTATLENRGYLVKKPNGKFGLGARFLSLGTVAKDRVEIIHVLRPELVQLVEDTMETVHLVIWTDQYHVILIDKVLSHMSMRSDLIQLKPRNPHLTSTGMVLLATKPDDYIQNYIENVPFAAQTPYSYTETAQLWIAIEKIREQGYAINNQQHEVGRVSIAVPVRNSQGQVIAAISISGSPARIGSKKEFIISRLKTAAQNISKLPI